MTSPAGHATGHAVGRPAISSLIAEVHACQGCGACLLTCPEHAIRPSGEAPGTLHVLADRCSGCGECVEVCPVDAIVMVAAASEESRTV